MVIKPLSTRLIKPNFCFRLSHRRSTTVSLETRNRFVRYKPADSHSYLPHSHPQHVKKVNPVFLIVLDSSSDLCCDECPIFATKPRRCASSVREAVTSALWPTHENIALKRSIGKQRHKHRRRKKEKNQKVPFTVIYHPHDLIVKSSYETFLARVKHFQYHHCRDLMKTLIHVFDGLKQFQCKLF